jgi:hypothetical protein
VAAVFGVHSLAKATINLTHGSWCATTQCDRAARLGWSVCDPVAVSVAVNYGRAARGCSGGSHSSDVIPFAAEPSSGNGPPPTDRDVGTDLSGPACHTLPVPRQVPRSSTPGGWRGGSGVRGTPRRPLPPAPATRATAQRSLPRRPPASPPRSHALALSVLRRPRGLFAVRASRWASAWSPPSDSGSGGQAPDPRRVRPGSGRLEDRTESSHQMHRV